MWILYMLRCGDGSMYTGITNDLGARLAAHRGGHGAKYTRGRGPLSVVATRRCLGKGDALRLEHAVKKLSPAQKRTLLVRRGLAKFALSLGLRAR
jgi:predicted GIY-YIG superfamily endonuclease